MATMVCKQICIEPTQEAMLRCMARHTGLTEGKLIGQAIDGLASTFFGPRQDPVVW